MCQGSFAPFRLRVRLAPILLGRAHVQEGQEGAMDRKTSLHCLAVIGVAALAAGCGPDGSERQGAARGGSPQSRPGDSGVPRNEPGQPPGAADRDATVRPPTTAPNPAAPGAAAAPPSAEPQLVARAEIQPLGDHTA